MADDDLGRITPGAKADFVMVDIAHPAMQPVYDPVRRLVYAAGERAIRHVLSMASRWCATARRSPSTMPTRVPGWKWAQRRAIEKVPRFDRAGRSAAEIMPPTFPSS